MKLEIVTPFGKVLDEECDEAVAPGAYGLFGVLPEHIPYLTTVPAGVLWYRKGNEVRYFSVANGYAEVFSDKILLLVATAERAEEIDLERAQRRLEKFRKQMDEYEGPMDDPDIKRLRIRILREESRIEAYNIVHGTHQ